MPSHGMLIRAVCLSSAFALAAGCGGKKQEASIGLEAARLAVASARNAGAEKYSLKSLNHAETALADAEGSFKKGKYSDAREGAESAVGFANQAADGAKRSAAEASTKSKKSTRRAARR